MAPEATIGRGAVVARVAALLPALAFAVAGVALATYQPAAAAVETLHLTLVGGCALAGSALLAGAKAPIHAVGPLLASLALWALPAGPPRGIALGVLLVAGVVVAAWHRLRARELDAAAAVGGAVAVHALMRAGELLPATLFHGEGSATAIARLVVPPVLAGLALAELARRHTLETIFTAAMAVALAAQGFTATAAVALVAMAAVAAARSWRAWSRGTDRMSRATETMHRDGIPAKGSALAAAEERAGGIRRAGLAAIGFALAAIALAAARPAAGALAIAAASLAMLPRAWVWLVAAAPLAYGLITGADPGRLLALAALVALLPWSFLPWPWLPGGAPLRRLLGAVLVGAGGTLLLPPPAGLAAAAAALALASDDAGARGSLQRGWLASLFALVALAAGYPWLRAQPLDVALGLLGLPALSSGHGVSLTTLLLTAAVLLAGALLLHVTAIRVSPRLASGLLVVGVAAAALVAMPPPARNVAPADGVVLRGDAPVWSGAVDGPPVARVRVVSTLADAAALPAGTAVATLSLERAGRPLAAWTLRVGADTAEWAADRADLRGVAARGPVWWSWLPPPGTSFAHAYAATWRLSRPVAADALRIARDPALPPGMILSLLRVEVNR